ncbi:MAG: hypothetical protein M1608_12580, partial [Candidatus Omnitrophica bacterium]|nr:hypothetical protein [Candidatus Omnitrophota bacterium]
MHNNSFQEPTSEPAGRGGLWVCAALLILLAAIFHSSFRPDQALFANDGPLGALNAQANNRLGGFTGYWQDLNWVGIAEPTALPNITMLFYVLAGPVAFAKFYASLSLLILGLSAYAFFRQMRFHRFVCVLGGLAAALNMNVFSNACWGLPTRALTLAATFLALAALQSATRGRPVLKGMLAGLAVGLGLMEGYDVGAIFSLYVAAFALFLCLNQPKPGLRQWVHGISRVALVAVFAAMMSAQALTTLIETQIKGVVGMEPQQKSAQESWDWATQWSLPKIETLRVIIPGLFGYRMDTPGGGNYWGTVGRQPGWEQSHQGFPRHSGSGEYAGLLVVLLAIWALAQSMRGQASPYSPGERRMVWFWSGLGLVSLLLAYGRYAPFYRVIYELPFFSTIRNPIKFMHPFHLTVLVLFGYGLQDLSRRYLGARTVRGGSTGNYLKTWWNSAPAFDKKWSCWPFGPWHNQCAARPARIRPASVEWSGSGAAWDWSRSCWP